MGFVLRNHTQKYVVRSWVILHTSGQGLLRAFGLALAVSLLAKAKLANPRICHESRKRVIRRARKLLTRTRRRFSLRMMIRIHDAHFGARWRNSVTSSSRLPRGARPGTQPGNDFSTWSSST